MDDLVDGFVDAMLAIVARTQREHVALAASAVRAMLAEPATKQRGAPAPKSAAPKSAAPKSAAPKSVAPKSVAPKAAAPKSAAPTVSAPRPVARKTPAKRPAPAPAPPPVEPAAAEPSSQSPRDALVLEAVRSLGRGTAGEIARRGGLPNGTAYVVLRSLVARGQVARSDTARGVEYRVAG
jgi:hypothetical protein